MSKVILSSNEEGYLRVGTASYGLDVNKAAKASVQHGTAFKVVEYNQLPVQILDDSYPFSDALVLVLEEKQESGFGSKANSYQEV
jgi:hypothetical protein